MRRLFFCLITVLALVLGFLSTSPANSDTPTTVWLLEINAAISPASADYFLTGLRRAEAAGATLLVLQIDTPGGLDASMRDMVKAILNARIPVATYVAPAGSRAASAGTYILYASHIAAMAPATNVGSSTPVSISPMGAAPEQPAPNGAMDKKRINDAVAYIRGLAELRGRNLDWAEQTVREAANLSASDALEQGVIDLIATDLDRLLAKLHGREVQLEHGPLTLQLENAEIHRLEPSWRYELLNLITDPNVAYILLMIGLYGLILEFYNPGVGIAGVIGVICLLLAGFALHMLPINYAGLALILVGVGLMVAEAFSPSFGVLGVGGLAAFVAGSVLLMDSELPGYQVSLPLIGAFAASSAAIFIFVVGAALRARHIQVVSGQEAIIGAPAEALADFDGQGRVHALGENWHAISDVPIKRGQALRITAIDELTVHVEPAGEQHPVDR
ncbi:MAG: NfeD family protein [Thiohalomonadaceae bacterium]